MAHLAMRSGRTVPWQRWALAFFAGAFTVFGFAPFDFFPVLLVSFTCLVWQIDGAVDTPKPIRTAAVIGWWFGFGYHLAGIYWIGFAFLVDADTFAWMIPFVAVLMPGGLALFTALFGGLARVLFDHVPGPSRIVGFAVLWMLMEWLRGHILTGFPWNLVGYTWASVQPVAQSVSLFGIYGLSLLTLLLAASPAALTARKKSTAGVDLSGTAPLLASLGVIALLGVWGGVRLQAASDDNVDGVTLRIVQPSIPQREKWKPENRSAIFQEYLQLTEGSDDITHVIWPESAIPFLIDRQPAALEAIGGSLTPGKVLLTGAARMDVSEGRDGGGNQIGDTPAYFNSVHVINSTGAIRETYDKYHLVPFGEYLPLGSLLRRLGLTPVVASVGGFSKGPGPRLLDVPGAGQVIPLICYEAIFPGRISRTIDGRPDWILNVTNDAWFGDTTGPRQHFTQGRFRAIEEGLPLVRSANTGISGIVDSYGRIIGHLELGQRGVLDGPLPVALAPTLYARAGDALFWFMMVCLTVWVGYRSARQ